MEEEKQAQELMSMVQAAWSAFPSVTEGRLHYKGHTTGRRQLGQTRGPQA